MKQFTLKRLLSLPDATLGILLDANDRMICLTAELPWKDNKPFISCVPDGIYHAMRITSARRSIQLYEFVEVPDRTHIQIHIANAPMRPINDEGDTELLGCIAPGLKYGKLEGFNAVMSSGPAFRNFMELTEEHPNIIVSVINNF